MSGLNRGTESGLTGYRLRSALIAASVFCAPVVLAAPLPEDTNPPPALGDRPAQAADAPGLADRDGDHLSDGLQARLAQAAPGAKFDVIVRFDAKGNSAAQVMRQIGLFTVRHEYSIIDGFAATMTAAQASALARAPGIFRVEDDAEVSVRMSDALYDFGAFSAQSLLPLPAGQGSNICIIDTGINQTHEQFDSTGKIAECVSFSSTESTCADGHSHGTHVAAIAAGDGAAGSTIQGVAPGARLYIAKGLDSGGSGSESGIISAIQWCTGFAVVDIISMSFGTEPGSSDGTDALSQAVNNAVVNHGRVAVVAAGNAGSIPATIGSPGLAAQAITVAAAAEYSAPIAAVNHSKGIYLAPFSSRGPSTTNTALIKPDITAPGVSITSAVKASNTAYGTFSGTSMATPYTAGAVALALAADPDLTPAQVKQLIADTASARGVAGKDIDWGHGLLDVHALVARAQGTTGVAHAFPPHYALTGRVTGGSSWRQQFQVDDSSGDPIAATMLIDGNFACTWFIGLCFETSVGPDLDIRLLAPGNVEVDRSECPADFDPEPGCGYAQSVAINSLNMSRQETVQFSPTASGCYEIEVYGFGTDVGPFSIDVSGPVQLGCGTAGNTPPVATARSITVNEDSSIDFDLWASDVDPNTTLTYSIATQPSKGAVSGGTGAGRTYAPNPNVNGSDSFTFKANDGTADSNTATVSITIAAVNDAPVANNRSVTTRRNRSVAFTITASDIDGNSLSYLIASLPTRGTLSGTPPNLIYTPSANYIGSDGFTFRAFDGIANSNLATVSITVRR